MKCRARQRLSHITRALFNRTGAVLCLWNRPTPMRSALPLSISKPNSILQPIGNHQPRTTQCQVIPRHLVGHGLVQWNLRSLDFDSQHHATLTVNTSNVNSPLHLTESHGILQHHSGHGPTRRNQCGHHVLPNPLLGLELDPFFAHLTTNRPLPVAFPDICTAGGQRQFGPIQTRVLIRDSGHAAKMQRTRTTLGHLETEPDGQPHSSI